MNRTAASLLLLISTALVGPARAQVGGTVVSVVQPAPFVLGPTELEIPLHVRNPSPFPRHADPVTSGLPFPVGVVDDPAELSLLDAEGHPVPLQTRVLSRYWRRGGSVKWLLLDFRADVGARSTAVYRLVRAPRPAFASPLRVEADERGIVVDTGLLRCRFDRASFRLFDAVDYDLDLNGDYAADERIVQAAATDGARVQSVEQRLQRISGQYFMHGSIYEVEPTELAVEAAAYAGRVAPLRHLVVEEAGPLRVVILAKGAHDAVEPGPGRIANGLYDFTARITLWAGRSDVGVEYAIENTRLERWREKPNALYLFRGLELATTVRVGEDARVTFGLERLGARFQPLKDVVYAGNPAVTALTRPAGPHYEAYQESAGGGDWNRMRQWTKVAAKHLPTRFRGFRVVDRAASAGLAAGDRLDGWVDLGDARWGVTVGIKDLAMRFPKGLRVDGKTVIADLLPHRYSHPWHVDFGERLTTRVSYAFHPGGLPAAAMRAGYEARNRPLFAWAGARWYARTDALWGGLGVPDSPLRFPPTWDADGDWFDMGMWVRMQAGFRAFGNSSDYNGGGAKQTLFSAWSPFLQTGIPALQRLAEANAESRLDQPSWLIDDAVPDVDFIQKPYFEGRMMTDTEWFAYRRDFPPDIYRSRFFEQGPLVFYSYKGVPDHEHRGNWPAVEHYFLTGSQAALESIRALGARIAGWHYWCLFAITHPDKSIDPIDLTLKEPPLDHEDIDAFTRNELMLSRWGYYSRVYGWNALGTAMVYDATGDDFYLQMNDWMIRKLAIIARRVDGGIDAERDVVKPWMLGIVIQGLHALWLVEPDEALEELIIGIGDYLRLECRHRPGRGMPYELAEGKKTTGDYQHHSCVLMGLALAYRHSRRPELIALCEEYRRHMQPAMDSRDVMDNRSLFPRAQHWLQELTVPRSDATPPAAVTDLAARVVDGRIELAWTAPADGADAVADYRVKVSPKPIVEHAGPKGRRRTRSFWAGENVRGEPAPAPPGTREQFSFGALATFEGFGAKKQKPLAELRSGRHWVAIKSRDREGNWSPLSNVVVVRLP